MKDLKTMIAEQPFFKGMAPEYLDALERHANEAEFKAGHVLFRQNEAAYQLYLLTEGKVALESYVPRAEDIPLQVLGKGEVLGWSWLFPPFIWHFQARALEPTGAIVLDAASLLVACEKDHHLGYEMMQRIAQVVINRLQAIRKRLVLVHQTEPILAVEEPGVPAGASQGLAGKSLVSLLSEHPFLKEMDPEHVRILAEAAFLTKFGEGQSIFREGDLANRFYLIQHGKVLIEMPHSENGAVPVQMIRSGDVLGWSWLFPPFYWHFDARALESTTAIFLYGTRLREQCEEDHDLGYELMKRVARVLIQRLQATRQQFLELHASRKQPVDQVRSPLGTGRCQGNGARERTVEPRCLRWR